MIEENKFLPKISVITPSFNQGQFLEKTIVSVITQNYPDLEYIIMDGGSTDNSIEIIKKYENEITYWKSEKDLGQSDAINKGFKVATGEILAWLNSDDVYCTKTLLTIGEFFLNNPNIDLIYGNSFTIDEHDKIIRETISVKYNKYAYITQAFSLHQASMFWRRELYDRSEGVQIDLYTKMDYDLWLQFYNLNAKISHINETLSCYRTHPETKTRNTQNITRTVAKERLSERLSINMDGLYYKSIFYIMRIRTLFIHVLNFRFRYLIKSCRKK